MVALNMRQIFKLYKRQIVFTYVLFTIEFLLFLATPFVIGLAIDSLLKKNFYGIEIFIAQHLTHLLVSRCRRLYNVRIFTKIYNEVAVNVISNQKEAGTEKSVIIARATLTKDLINFFENDITNFFNTIYSIFGSLIILAFYDSMIFVFCLLLIIPSSLLNYYFNKKNRLFYNYKNDELEKQVKIIEFDPMEKIRDHYRRLAKWDIKLSDVSALNYTIMEFFILFLIIGSLIVYCRAHQTASSGTILAVFQYLIKFIVGIDNIPILNSQFANIKDIQRRVQKVEQKISPTSNCLPFVEPA